MAVVETRETCLRRLVDDGRCIHLDGSVKIEYMTFGLIKITVTGENINASHFIEGGCILSEAIAKVYKAGIRADNRKYGKRSGKSKPLPVRLYKRFKLWQLNRKCFGLGG